MPDVVADVPGSNGAGDQRAAGFPGDAPWCAQQLRDEVDRLVKSHRSELNDCLERWLQSVQESSAFIQPPISADTTPISLHPSMVPAFAPCAPPQTAHIANGTVVHGVKEHQVMQMPQLSPHAAMMRSPRPSLNSSHKAVSPAKQHGQSPPRRASRGSRRKKTMGDILLASPGHVANAHSWLQRFTSSRHYEWASGTLICLNAFFIGWQTQHVAHHAEEAVGRNQAPELTVPGSFLALQAVFSVIFGAELGLRWVCDGVLGFFQGEDRWWNVLDIFVVTFSFLDLFLHAAVSQNDVLGSVSVLRVLRVVRVVRVARLIRIMKFFRELRMMIFSILKSMKSLLWVILVLGMTFYIFGITFTVATSTALDTKEKWLDPDTNDLRTYFGTLDRSLLSLFMSMCGGNDWSIYYDALQKLPIQYRFLFLLYISFAVFAVVNIVTGVFVESALQSNSEDRVITAHEELEAKKDYLRQMREIFNEMDEDETGSITVDEFEAKLDDERIIAYFNAMKLDISDARRFFWLIDFDQSGEVDIDEFLYGCYKLQGESRMLDIKLMQCEVTFLRESFLVFAETVNTIQQNVCELRKVALPPPA